MQYIVAPYEADAQMAFLALNNHVHAVITEDSDLLPYGCPRVPPCVPLLPEQLCLVHVPQCCNQRGQSGIMSMTSNHQPCCSLIPGHLLLSA